MGSINTNDELPRMQQAAQYIPAENKVRVHSIPVPQPTDDELLIKTACSSLCHSDLMLFEASDEGPVRENKPVTIGHEASGIIISAPKNCTDPALVPGAKIGFLCPANCCYECEGCQIHNAFCERGSTLMGGFGRDGFFQEYVTTHWRNALVLPDAMDLYVAAPLFCAGVTSWNGVKSAGIQPGQWMAIIGCGGLGHLGIQYAKALGYKVIGIDLMDGQLEEATASGADHVFNPASDKAYVSKIKEITNGGCHAAVNFTASKAAYDHAPDVLRVGGIMMIVGLPIQPLTISSLDVALGKYRIGGAGNGTPKDLGPCVKFSAQHGIKPHITYYKLDQIQDMIDLMEASKARGRLAVKFF